MSLTQAATMLICSVLSATAAATEWIVDNDQSQLGFVATYDGVGFDTRFERFDTRIRFDPQQLEEGYIDVVVDITSVNSDSADRDEGMLGFEWFNAEKFPQARFVSTGFRHIEAGAFEVAGRLTIKGITHSIVLPFVWNEVDNGAQLKGKTILQRTDFKIGIGEWATDPIIGFEVDIVVDLYLKGKN
jgi:polyisoprenoid-binding protein YceI